MRARVLGSSAGGALPQWNCACDNCTLARAGDPRVVPRTQDCVALSGEPQARRWLLVNASPDVRWQIEAFAPLQPRAPRDTGIAAIVLTNGDLDHVLGLLALRESQPLGVVALHRSRSRGPRRPQRDAADARPDAGPGHPTLVWSLGREVVLEGTGSQL